MDNDEFLKLVKSKQKQFGVKPSVIEDKPKQKIEVKPQPTLDYSKCWICKGTKDLTKVLESIPICQSCLDDVSKRSSNGV